METKKTKKDTKGPKEHKKNWQEQTATVDDIRAFLDERILLRHNVVTGRVVRRSMEEMRSMRCQMVHGDDTEDTANTVIF